MQYRREVDGLRALAVMPVVFFHAGVSQFSGGYIGVDVFFVISGYLITSIIIEQQKEKEFSLIAFYERRARRILPALFVVVLVCVPFAALLLLPKDFAEFSRSVTAVVVFVSNVYFWRDSGYFAPAMELKPLVHTWSLAVEEQFYLLFPLFLSPLYRRVGTRATYILLGLAVVSLAVAHYGALTRPAATFYLLPTRAWELLCGALLAIFTLEGRVGSENKTIREIASLLGLAAIGYAVFVFNDKTPFPSLYGLLPVAGTLLLLAFATEDTFIGRFLATNVLVGIGLISYSVYLWHQPLLAFVRYRSLQPPSALFLSVLVVLVFLLAYASWRLVEVPFRQRHIISRNQIFGFSIVIGAAIMGLGVFGMLAGNGFLHPREWIEKASKIQHRFVFNFGLDAACDKSGAPSAICMTSSAPEILLWGDSNAMHLATAIVSSEQQVNLAQATFSGCGPFLDIAPIDIRFDATWSLKCIESNDAVMAFVRATPSLKYVVLGSAFGQYVGDNVRVLTKEGKIELGSSVALDYFIRTVERLRQANVMPIVFSPAPQTGSDVGHCLSRAMLYAVAFERCDFPLVAAEKHQARILEFLRAVEGKGISVIFLSDKLCVNGRCRTSIDEVPLYRDHGHFSNEGSTVFGRAIDLGRFIQRQ